MNPPTRLNQIDRQGASAGHIIARARREPILPLWKDTAAAVKMRPASACIRAVLKMREDGRMLACRAAWRVGLFGQQVYAALWQDAVTPAAS
jgi:hypothetical protein